MSQPYCIILRRIIKEKVFRNSLLGFGYKKLLARYCTRSFPDSNIRRSFFHLTSQHNLCKDYSFILPNATPAMMYFESAKYTMNSGNTVKVNPR